METSQPAAYTDLQHLTQLIQRVDDRQQLAELISRYGMVVDDRDFDKLGSLFAPDGQFQAVKGRDAVVAFYRYRTSLFTTSYHYAHTWHFDLISNHQASGVVNAHAELCINGQAVHIALRYLDTYTKIDGHWLFQSRALKFRYVLPLSELANGLDQPLRVRWPGTEPQLADLPDQLQTYIDSRKAPA